MAVALLCRLEALRRTTFGLPVLTEVLSSRAKSGCSTVGLLARAVSVNCGALG